jgi:signal transduction histidine kinase
MSLQVSSFIYIFSILVNSLLALWVLLNWRKRIVNVIFILFIITLIGWLFTLFLYYNVYDPLLLLFVGRLNFAVVVLMVFWALEFAIFFPKEVRHLEKWKHYLLMGETMVLFLITLFTPLIAENEIIINGSRQAMYGPLYFLFIAHFIFYVFAVISIFIRKIRRFSGIYRMQSYYVLLGLSLTALFGFITNILIPLLGFQEFANLGPLSTFFLAGSFSYAIVKYRLMDIRMVLSKTAVYFISLSLVIGMGFLAVFINNNLSSPLSFNILLSLFVVFAVLIYHPLFKKLESLASKYFYYTFYSYQKVLTDLGYDLTKVLDLEKLSSLITKTLMETMKLERTVILLRNQETGTYTIQKNIGFKEENGISLVKDNFLTQYLKKTQRPLVYEELSLLLKDTDNKEEKERIRTLQTNMKRIEAVLCVPLLRKEEITGLIVLGSKISGDPYSREDINLLTTLSSQASIALENAKLYEKVEDLSQNLQKKVEEQTKELKKAYQRAEKAYRVEKEAHHQLKELSRAKDQFIMATQHHLRTPLTVMKGYSSMILEGDYGKVSKKAKEKLQFFQESTEKLIRLVNSFLDISQFQMGKKVLKKKKVSLNSIVKEVIDDLKREAKEKGITLKFKKPEKTIFIEADKDKLKESFYNITDNAVKYTKEGGVQIRIKKKGNKALTEIEDTGIGMTKEQYQNLFSKMFERGKEAQKAHGLGKGIGLYIASNIIESHKGKVWARSEGKGKGSCFFVELPLVK